MNEPPPPWMHRLFAHIYRSYSLNLTHDEIYQIVRIVREEDQKAINLTVETP